MSILKAITYTILALIGSFIFAILISIIFVLLSIVLSSIGINIKPEWLIFIVLIFGLFITILQALNL